MSALSLTSEKVPTPAGALVNPVLSELWVSFVSLMRSHLAALQTIGKLLQVKVLETSPNSFTAGDLDGNVAVTVNLADGRGAYETRSCGGPAEKGLWQLHADGTAFIGEGKGENGDGDMELAVEFFAQELIAARSEGATR